MQIGVIGSFGTINQKKALNFPREIVEISERVGELLAEKNIIIVCGGDDKGGLIEAVARGAKRKNGTIVGFLVGNDKSNAMEFVDINIPTGMTYGGREYLLTLACDSIIAIRGGSGTLNEITVAYQNKIPVVVLENTGGWSEKLSNIYLDERKRNIIHGVSKPEEAVELAIKLAKR